MASVTGKTAEEIDKQLADMVTSVRVDDNGQLIYKTKSGQETNTGALVSPKLAVAAAYPVNSIYIGTSPANPQTLLGVGTWVRFGKGRTLMSLDEAQTEFDTPEETGGAKQITLTAAQSGLPGHAHSYSGTTSSNGVEANTTTEDSSSNPVGAATMDRAGGSAGLRYISGSEHAHGYSGTTTTAGGQSAAQPHSILPPYITVYVWKRTA